MTISTDISLDLVKQYEKDGYVIVPDVLSVDETEAIRAEALRIYRGECGQVEGLLPAVPDETDDTLIRRYICVHHPHKISPLVRDSMAHPRIVDVLTRLIGPDVKAMQSMLFTKGEGKPGQAWHQDEFFIPTRDRSLTAVWIALDDATVENGCLWVLPGSHAPGIIYPERGHDDERFDCTVEAYGFPHADGDAVPVEIPAGTAVFFNGYLLHRSLPNTGRHGLRRALAHHYMNARSPLPWKGPPPGVHVGAYDYRDVVQVAGRDPYAYRGYDDITRPHIRADREGGCDR